MKALMKRAGAFREANAQRFLWGRGGQNGAKNVDSPGMIDLTHLGVDRTLWLPGATGNYVSTPEKNLLDYYSSTFEGSTGRWNGLNQNLLKPNDSMFDTDASGWYGIGNVTVARSTDFGLVGSTTASLKATCTGTTTGIYPSLTAAARPFATPGQVYTGIASVRSAATGRIIGASLGFFDSAGAQLSEVSGARSASNIFGWTQVHVVAQAPTNATSVRLTVAIEGNPVTGEVHYIDAASVSETPNGNLVTNPDVENGLAPHASGNGGGVSLSTARSLHGRSSIYVTSTGGYQGLSVGNGNTLKMVVGRTYTVRARVYVPSGTAVINMAPDQLTVTANDCVINGVAGNRDGRSLAAGTWHDIKVTGVANDPTLSWYIRSGDAATVPFYVDALQMVEGSVVPPYLPPSSHNLALYPCAAGSGWGAQIGSSGAYMTGAGTGSPCDTFFRFTSGVQYDGFSENTVHVAQGRRIVVSFYMRVSGTHNSGDFLLQNIQDNSNSISVPGNMGIGGWQRVEIAHTEENDGRSFRWGLKTMTSGRTGSVDVTGWQVEVGDAATPFVDGWTAPGFSWDQTHNLVSNPSFETNTAGWEGLNKNLLTANQSSLETDTTGWAAVSNVTIARSTAQAFDGTASLSLTATAAGDMFAATPTGTAGVPVVPGQVYTAVAHLRAATVGRSGFLSIFWYDSAGALISSPNGPTFADNASGWQQTRFTAQAPSNATFGRVRVLVSAPAAAEVHYVDAVGLFTTPTGNLVTNPDFENGTTGWNSPGTFCSAATITQSLAQSYTGRASLSVVTAAVIGSGTSTDFAGTAGQTYTGSMWVRCASAVTLQVGVSRNDGTNVVFASTAVAANTWTRLSATTTFTTSGTGSVVIRSTTATAVTFFVDAVQVVVGSAPVDYLPPTTHNLLIDPKRVTTGWDEAFGSGFPNITQDYGTAPDGTQTATRFQASQGYRVIGKTYKVSPSTTHTFSVWAKRNSATTGTNRLQINIGANASWLEATDTWQKYTFSGAANASGDLPLDAQNSFEPSTDVLIAQGQLEAGSVATPYTDGAQGAGFRWDASENLLSAAVAEGTGGWVSYNPNTTVTNGSTALAFSGASSVALTSGAAGIALAYSDYPTGGRIGPNTTYTLTAYARFGTAIDVRLGAQLETATASERTDYAPSVTLAANTWTRLTLTFTTSATIVNMRALLEFTATAASQVVYFDAVQLEQRPYATAYAAPGTAHASTSTRSNPWVLGGTSLEQLVRNVQTGGIGSAFLNLASYTNPGQSGLLTYGAETVVAVAPNTTYTVSQNVQGTHTRRVVDGVTGAVLVASASDAPNPLSTSRRVLTFTTGPTTTSVRVQTLASLAGVPSDLVYIDAVQLEQRPYATAFGATGAANSSTSTRTLPWVAGGDGFQPMYLGSWTTPVQGAIFLCAEASSAGSKRLQSSHNLQYGPVLRDLALPSNTEVAFSWFTISGGNIVVHDAITGAVLPVTTVSDSENVAGWSRRVRRFTTGASGRVRVAIPLNDDYYMDAVQVERGATSTPYSPPSNIRGDLDIRVHAALEDWTDPGGYINTVVAKRSGGASYSYGLRFESGRMAFYCRTLANVGRGANCTANVPFPDGDKGWIRVTAADTGTGNTDVIFWTSYDGVTWTQLGVGVTYVGTGFEQNEAPLCIGGFDGGEGAIGKILEVQVRAGINGPMTARYVANDHTNPASYVDSVGKLGWTLNRAGAYTAEIVDRNCWAWPSNLQYLIFDNRWIFDLEGSKPFTFVGNQQRRSNPNGARYYYGSKWSTSRSGIAGNAGWDVYEEAGQFGFRTLYDPNYPRGTRSTVLCDGNWRVGGGGRTAAGTVNGVSDGVIGGANADLNFANTDSASTAPVYLGSHGANYGWGANLGQWWAIFRRELTNDEHAALGAWNGRVATEPAFIRASATLYVNADDPEQRTAYRASNKIINLAGQMVVRAKIAGGWTTAGARVDRKVPGGWERIG